MRIARKEGRKQNERSVRRKKVCLSFDAGALLDVERSNRSSV